MCGYVFPFCYWLGLYFCFLLSGLRSRDVPRTDGPKFLHRTPHPSLFTFLLCLSFMIVVLIHHPRHVSVVDMHSPVLWLVFFLTCRVSMLFYSFFFLIFFFSLFYFYFFNIAWVYMYVSIGVFVFILLWHVLLYVSLICLFLLTARVVSPAPMALWWVRRRKQQPARCVWCVPSSIVLSCMHAWNAVIVRFIFHARFLLSFFSPHPVM